MSATTRTNTPAAPARATTIRRSLFRGERPGHRPPTENVSGSAARVRLRLLAAFLPVTAALYVGAEAMDPKGTDQVVTYTAVALKLLPIAAAHSSQLYLSGALSVLALGGLAVSYAAIAALVTGRGWVIATIAALLGGLGAFAGAMLNVLGGINLAAAASAHMAQGAAARFLVTSFGSVPSQVVEYVYFASEYAAPVLMGFALWRSRVVPRWLAVLFTVSLEVAESDGRHRPQGRAVHAAVRRRDDPARGPDLAGRRPPHPDERRHAHTGTTTSPHTAAAAAAQHFRELT